MSFNVKGVMLDPARLTERRKVYRDYVRLLADSGYNTIFWHFTDDQGCALKFPSHPELASRHAYTPEEMEKFIRFAGSHGIQVIPEVESFGHTGFITGKKKYAGLAEKTEGSVFGAMCPFTKKAQKILRDLFNDTARIFPSEYIHAGLDEVGFGSHSASKKKLKSKKKWQLFAEHINWVHSEITGQGKKMMMWGDHLLGARGHAYVDSEALDEKIADQIPKDIVICDWHYEPKPDPGTLDFFLKKGFRVIACPAVIRHGIMNFPSRLNLDNLKNFARAAYARRKKGVIGMMNTVWTPYRNFPGASLAGIAYGGEAQANGGKINKDFFQKFVRQTFGINAPAKTAKAVEEMHTLSPDRSEFKYMCPAGEKEFLENTSTEKITGHQKISKEFKNIAKTLRGQRTKVKTNQVYFDDIVFAADCYAVTGGFTEELARARGLLQKGRRKRKRGDREGARRLFRQMHDLVKKQAGISYRLYQAGGKRWNKTRYPDDRKKDGLSPRYRYHDALLARLRLTAEFFRKLSKQAASISKDLKGGLDLPSGFPAF